MKKYLFVLFIAIIFFACKKNNTQNLQLTGVYNELSPYSGNTQLNFINSNEVVVTGGQLNNQFFVSSHINDFQIDGQRILFIADSGGIKNITTFWFEFEGIDSLILSTCDFGVPCYAASYYLTFTKQGK